MKKHLLFIFAGLLFSTAFKAQCTVDFTYTVTAGTLSVTGVGTPTANTGYGWQWGDGTSPSSGQNTSHTYAGSNTYSVCLTYITFPPPTFQPCTASVCKNVLVNFVGVNEYIKNLQNVKLSPNPAKSHVMIEFTLDKSSKLSIVVLDVTGKEVDTIEVEKEMEIGNYSKRYNTENLSSGIYFIRFKTENGTETKKLIVD